MRGESWGFWNILSIGATKRWGRDSKGLKTKEKKFFGFRCGDGMGCLAGIAKGRRRRSGLARSAWVHKP